MVELHDKNKKTWRLFMINISLILILFFSGIFLGFLLRTNRIIEEQMFTTARSHFKNITLTRSWNADHGGVYVEKKEGVLSNPYLKDPDITATNGKVYTKKNPALMTREISEYAKRSGDFIFNMTSLNPLNPNNVPDKFETNALKMFETNIRESSAIENIDGKTIFRYMAPLFVEKGCLYCHEKQGYKLGEVRGGISVSFDISHIKKEMRINKILLIIISLITVSILITIVFIMISRLANKLTIAYKTISLMAVTDELTQLYNRRHFHSCLDEEILRTQRYQNPIGLLMLDIDDFKRVNDNYGHQVGDKVIVEVADIIKFQTRKTDIMARYGGEEMVGILPETDLLDALKCAEKIRQKIQEKVFKLDNGDTFGVTVSIGVTSIRQIGISKKDAAKNIIKMADEALYKAKNSGKNKVESL
jgi:diguanylate cyclase (GGDEF)-like protein